MSSPSDFEILYCTNKSNWTWKQYNRHHLILVFAVIHLVIQPVFIKFMKCWLVTGISTCHYPCSNTKLRHFITSTIYNFIFICSLLVLKKVPNTSHITTTSQHLIGQRIKRLPWADLIPLVTFSNARLISHRNLRCHWPMGLIVILRARWASAASFPVCVRLAGAVCWRHGPASWSEWEAGLKRGVGPERERERETGEGAPRSSEQHRVGPANRILRMDRFLFLPLLFFFKKKTDFNDFDTGVHETSRAMGSLRLNLWASRLVETSGTVRKKLIES